MSSRVSLCALYNEFGVLNLSCALDLISWMFTRRFKAEKMYSTRREEICVRSDRISPMRCVDQRENSRSHQNSRWHIHWPDEISFTTHIRSTQSNVYFHARAKHRPTLERDFRGNLREDNVDFPVKIYYYLHVFLSPNCSGNPSDSQDTLILHLSKHVTRRLRIYSFTFPRYSFLSVRTLNLTYRFDLISVQLDSIVSCASKTDRALTFGSFCWIFFPVRAQNHTQIRTELVG